MAALGDDVKPFSQRAAQPRHYHGCFNTIKGTIGVGDEAYVLPPVKKSLSVTYMKKFEHDKPFRPNGCEMKPHTFSKEIGTDKFPEYVCSKPDVTKCRKADDYPDERDWRVTYKGVTRPTPSVALNYRNLKA